MLLFNTPLPARSIDPTRRRTDRYDGVRGFSAYALALGHAPRRCHCWHTALFALALLAGLSDAAGADIEASPRLEHPAQSPEPGATRTVDLGEGVRLELRWVPPGTFMMGSKLSAEQVASTYGGVPEHFQHEHPRRQVTITRGFWMGKYEVTNAQYRRYKAEHSSREHQGHPLDGDQLPAVFVSWREAQAFCDWLSEHSGESFGLPTEAQWEYACRAGTDTVRYGGDDDLTLGRYANVADRTAKMAWSTWATVDTSDGHLLTAPIGSLQPNAYGLYDMLGNVYEWCSDYYESGYYARAPSADPCNDSPSPSRVARGGGWESTSEACRAAYRIGDDPDDHYSSIGFRVVAR